MIVLKLLPGGASCDPMKRTRVMLNIILHLAIVLRCGGCIVGTFSTNLGVVGSTSFSKGQHTFTVLFSDPQNDFLRKSP